MTKARRPRPGEWVCGRHGIVTPLTGGPVPVCPTCRQMALEAVTAPGGDHVLLREPSPAHCGEPEQVVVGWDPCVCGPEPRPHSGHRTWRCLRCGDRQVEGVD